MGSRINQQEPYISRN